MSKLFTKTYDTKLVIQEIKVSFPLAIITDTHTNTTNITKVRNLYPNLICLGDITFFQDADSIYNPKSVQYFIDNKIPCLRGNHEEIMEDKVPQQDYLKNLPIGFKLVLPDGTHYLCFHNRPYDLWSFTEESFTKEDFFRTYPVNEKTRAVIIGHHHRYFVNDYSSHKLIAIGRLSKDGAYAVLTEERLIPKVL